MTPALPPGTWSDPTVTGLGRVPMAPTLAPYDDVNAARRGEPSPWVVSLDGPWSFRLRGSPDEVTAADVDADTPVDAWDVVDVPGSWVLQGHGAPIYLNVRMPFGGQAPDVPADNPTGVYRRTFTLPSGWRRRRTLLRVGAANSMGYVWVNGTFAGLGTDSHLASTYDVTALLRRGSNTVCIVVPRWSAATWIEDQDQWWMPGLHRGIELISVPAVALADTAMVPGLDADGTNGTLDLDVSVRFGDAGSRPVTVEVLVEPLAGRRRRALATTGHVPVPQWSPRDEGDEHALAYTWPGHRVIATLRVPGIEPWNHETPHLYRSIVVLRDEDGAVLDVRTRRVGFRRVELADRALLVNGVPVVINGVNHHDIHPDRGPAMTAADARRDLELMKRHHVNAVRTSHYPKDEAFYDLCDELGLYVIDEANIESHARWRAVSDDPAYAAAFLERGMRMVLRDRSHPCVIAWSLGNESGYGPAHDAMAAWIRRVDPSRPIHYEGGFSRDLDAASPASDIVCPMYASVDRIVQWSREGRDRRPLILCEYNHAMGQAGGLADYRAVFGAVEGLQGGFVWEWADHGLRRRDQDGTAWFAYGGDFGERDHDGSFVCDGLVSPDREQHPLLAELAALTQPVTVERAGSGRLRVTNRRWFADTGDLEARWEVAVDGDRVASGRLALPAIAPRSAADVEAPVARPEQAGRVTLTVAFTPRRGHRPAWAGTDWIAAMCQVELPRSSAPLPPPRRTGRRVDTAVTDAGLAAGDAALGWPELTLWRAPTDNDDPPGEWRGSSPAARWRAHGLDRLEAGDVDVRRRGRALVRIVRYDTARGLPIEHRQRFTPTDDGGVSVEERAVIDREIDDLPRVGVRFTLPPEFAEVEWLGYGPGDSYPDRRAATRFGHWRADVAERPPFVVPQEYGLHLDTEWLMLRSPSLALTIAGDPAIAFSALPWSAAELTAATHAHELPPPTATHVHLDAAHRGLGTFACGPDTHPRHRLAGGTYRWAWTLTAATM